MQVTSPSPPDSPLRSRTARSSRSGWRRGLRGLFCTCVLRRPKMFRGAEPTETQAYRGRVIARLKLLDALAFTPHPKTLSRKATFFIVNLSLYKQSSSSPNLPLVPCKEASHGGRTVQGNGAAERSVSSLNNFSKSHVAVGCQAISTVRAPFGCE